MTIAEPIMGVFELPVGSTINNNHHTHGYPLVTVVVPTLNEAENLPHVLPNIPDWVHEVIIVDGHSKDNTVRVARELLPDVRIVMQQGKGKGAALRTGFAAATGDIIVMLDADGSADPAEMPAFIGALIAGCDFAKGSRFLQGGGTEDMEWYRRWGNWVLCTTVRAAFGGRYTDLCYGYNAFWKHILPKVNLDADGFEIETLFNIRVLTANLNVVEVPSFEAKRIYGTSNLNTLKDGWRVLKTIFRERLQTRAGRVHTATTSFRPAKSTQTLLPAPSIITTCPSCGKSHAA